MTINADAKAADAAAAATTSQIVDDTTRALARAWASAWDEVIGEWDAALRDLVAMSEEGSWPSRREILRAQRAKRAVELTAEKLNQVARDSGLIITRDLPTLTGHGIEAQAQMVLAQLPASMTASWMRIDMRAVEWIIQRSTRQIESLLNPLPATQQAVMKQVLIRGVTVGDNPLDAAEIMLDRLGGAFNGGLARAETIARTEMLDAMRHAARESWRANPDVVKAWRWTCTLSSRTCPACLAMDGQLFPISEDGPIGHQNCRCRATPVTATWKELGFDDIPEPQFRDKTGREWYDTQSEKTQRRIMGDDRYAALQSGAITWDDIPRVRHSDGWRDSIGVAPLPKGWAA